MITTNSFTPKEGRFELVDGQGSLLLEDALLRLNDESELYIKLKRIRELPEVSSFVEVRDDSSTNNDILLLI